MNEDFVTFDLAKKLKEKGFDEECFAHYDDLGNLLLDKDYWKLDSHILAPTISQVLKWLREEKKLHIMMATYSHYPNNTHDWGYEILNLQTYTCELYRCRFNSYEQAAIAGIEYCLDNLI